VAAVLVSRSARADEFEEHVGRADALARAERYKEALVELRAAYAQRPSAQLLHLIAQVQQRLGDTNAAIVAYEGVLASPGADEALKTDARARLASLQASQTLALRANETPVAESGVPVSFVAVDPLDRYAITTKSGGCVTPCRLLLKPGFHRVWAVGEGNVEVTLHVPTAGGTVRVQHTMTPMLATGIGLMAAGSAMMIAGNVSFLTSLGSDVGGGSPHQGILGITFGWAIGPLAHLVGVGLMSASVAKLVDANTVRPVGFDVATSRQGTTARMTFSF
jgi:hypothetical protein